MHPKSLAVAASLIPLGAGLSPEGYHALKLRSDEPCKQVRDRAAKWMSDNGIGRATPRVTNQCPVERLESNKDDPVPKNLSGLPSFVPATPAVPIRPSTAFACLRSVPLQRDSALQHINFLRPLFEWQSSVDYLRDPPQGFLSEAVDLPGGLDHIAAKLNRDTRGGYANEFEFLADLRTLTSVRPRDFHFAYSTLLLDLFDFPMSAQFVSISDDGLTLPHIYLYGNCPAPLAYAVVHELILVMTMAYILDDVKHADNGYTPSPVSTIDGIPALEFLQKASVNNGLSHDPDARFNSMFRSLATDANLNYIPPEPFALSLRDTTKVACHNGTEFVFSNAALLRANFTKVASGADLYDVYGRGNATDERPLASMWHRLAERNYTAAAAGYPEALTSTKIGSIAGFLPEGPEFSDVAVLAVRSFAEATHPDQASRPLSLQFREFNQVVVDLISAAKAANRTKLVLDFQGNGGGLVHNILALYFALFPASEILPLLWQARAHPQFAWLGKQLWNATTAQSPFPLEIMVRPDGEPWSSFEELYGPFPDDAPLPDGKKESKKRWGEHTHPALINATAYLRSSTDAFPLPDGWQYNRPPWTAPPFRPEDIVVVTDGQCGSACALTVAALTHAHPGVRTAALGGRPLRAPMQAVGQIRGGPAMSFAVMPPFDRALAPPGLRLPPEPWTYRPPLRLGGSQGVDVWGMGVMFNAAEVLPYDDNKGNVSDALGQGEVPLQFRYEAANCRLFYTWDMARDITAVWKAVARVAWRGQKCAPGSTTNSDGTMGAVPGYTKLVEDRYRLGKGAGAVGRK